MTRRSLKYNVIAVTLFYLILIIIGLIIYFDHGADSYYTAFKDLVLLWIAVPAAYLGYCFQKRSEFTAALSEMWVNLIESVNQGRQYTFETNPNQKLYGETLKSISKSIDEIRGVYRNLGETHKNNGIYPYESLQEIRKAVSQLDFNKYDRIKADCARRIIDHHWHLIKRSFLFEFDRPVPTVANTPYRKVDKKNYWKPFNCELQKEESDK